MIKEAMRLEDLVVNKEDLQVTLVSVVNKEGLTFRIFSANLVVEVSKVDLVVNKVDLVEDFSQDNKEVMLL